LKIPKGVIRSHKSKRVRPYNDQKRKGAKNELENTTQKTKNRAKINIEKFEDTKGR